MGIGFASKIGFFEPVTLDHGAHGAIEHKDAFFGCLQQGLRSRSNIFNQNRIFWHAERLKRLKSFARAKAAGSGPSVAHLSNTTLKPGW
jgi:hypothetical protein